MGGRREQEGGEDTADVVPTQVPGGGRYDQCSDGRVLILLTHRLQREVGDINEMEERLLMLLTLGSLEEVGEINVVEERLRIPLLLCTVCLVRQRLRE